MRNLTNKQMLKATFKCVLDYYYYYTSTLFIVLVYSARQSPIVETFLNLDLIYIFLFFLLSHSAATGTDSFGIY